MVTQVRIINLDILIKQNLMQAFLAFATLFLRKQVSANIDDVKHKLGFVFNENIIYIHRFNVGGLSEHAFTTHMIDALKKSMNIELTITEFDDAWNAMNARFFMFEHLLFQMANWNRKAGKRIILMGLINAKEMRFLKGELDRGQKKYSGVEYKMRGHGLIEICGIPLYTTSTEKKSAAELFEFIMEDLAFSEHYKMNTVIGVDRLFQPLPLSFSGKMAIQYIHHVSPQCVDPMLDLGVKQRYMTTRGIQKKAIKRSVPFIEWEDFEAELALGLKPDDLSDLECDNNSNFCSLS